MSMLICIDTLKVSPAGVLKYKKASEILLQQSGLPWTIVRPGRLTDGPYTSYDLNTLLQATAGTRQDIQVSLQDDQSGETSRIAVAGICLIETVHRSTQLQSML